MDIGTLAVLFFIAAFFDIVTVMVIKQGDQRSAPAIFRALATIYLDPKHPATSSRERPSASSRLLSSSWPSQHSAPRCGSRRAPGAEPTRASRAIVLADDHGEAEGQALPPGMARLVLEGFEPVLTRSSRAAQRRWSLAQRARRPKRRARPRRPRRPCSQTQPQADRTAQAA